MVKLAKKKEVKLDIAQIISLQIGDHLIDQFHLQMMNNVDKVPNVANLALGSSIHFSTHVLFKILAITGLTKDKTAIKSLFDAYFGDIRHDVEQQLEKHNMEIENVTKQ